MDKITELKKIIIDLKMELVRKKVPFGHCPYSYYTDLPERKFDCSIGCKKCTENFMQDMKTAIEQEVENL